MKPRVSDFVGALVLALVLFSLVAIIFISAIGEADRIRREEGSEAAVVNWQLGGGLAPKRPAMRAG